MTRNAKINLAILSSLADCGDHALPEETLLQHVRIRTRSDVTQEDFERQRDELKNDGAINSLPDRFDKSANVWLITERGQVRLAQ